MSGYIDWLLDGAADQYQGDGAVDLVLQTELAGSGYILSSLDDDIEDRLAEGHGG